MNMLSLRNTSLRYFTQKRINNKFPKLQQYKRTTGKKWYRCALEKPKIVILLVIAPFIAAALIPIDLPCAIEISNSTLNTITDQRIGNIATIISITLVVLGFLINNIAIKESLAYKILFTNSYFYSVLAFNFALIAGLIILSTFRDSLRAESQQNMILVGTLLILLNFYFIGNLFRRVIQYSSARHLIGLFEEELKRETVRRKNNEIETHVSGEIFAELLKNRGHVEFDFWHEMAEHDPNNHGQQSTAKGMIKDVNLGKIESYIMLPSALGIDLRFRRLKLHEELPNRNFIFHLRGSNTMSQMLRLSKSVATTTTRSELTAFSAFFASRIIQSIEANKTEELQLQLEALARNQIIEMEIDSDSDSTHAT